MELESELFDDYLYWFQKELEVQGIKSAKNYLFAIREFLYWLEQEGHKNLKRVNHKKIKAYFVFISNRKSLKTGRRLSQTTINEKCSAIDKFYDYLLTSKLIRNAPFIPKHRHPEYSEREVPTKAEVNEMFSCANSQRELAILSLAYGCGLRRSEIKKLKVHDLNLSNDLLLVNESKGRRNREVVMIASVKEYLLTYIQNERFNSLSEHCLSESALILNNQGVQASGEFIYGEFKRICKRSADKRIQSGVFVLHSLRHAIGTHLIENDADLHFVRRFLGHAEIDTTYRYIKRNKMRSKYLA